MSLPYRCHFKEIKLSRIYTFKIAINENEVQNALQSNCLKYKVMLNRNLQSIFLKYKVILNRKETDNCMYTTPKWTTSDIVSDMMKVLDKSEMQLTKYGSHGHLYNNISSLKL